MMVMVDTEDCEGRRQMMTINLSVNIQKSTYLKVKFGAKLHALAHSPTNNDHRKIKIEPWPYVTSLLAVGLA